MQTNILRIWWGMLSTWALMTWATAIQMAVVPRNVWRYKRAQRAFIKQAQGVVNDAKAGVQTGPGHKQGRRVTPRAGRLSKRQSKRVRTWAQARRRDHKRHQPVPSSPGRTKNGRRAA